MRIDDLRPVTRVPPGVRTRLGITVPVSIRFGVDDPLDAPGGYRYEIDARDRRILEQAISDASASSTDLAMQQIARTAILAGLRAVPPLGGLFAIGGELLMNFLGFGIFVSLSDVGGVKVTYVAYPQGPEYGESSVTAVITEAEVVGLTGGSCIPALKATMMYQVGRYAKREYSNVGQYIEYYASAPSFGLTWYGADGRELFSRSAGPSIPSTTRRAEDPPPTSGIVEFTGTTISESLGNQGEFVRPYIVQSSSPVSATRRYFGPEIGTRCGQTLDFDGPMPEIDDIGYGGNLDPTLTDIPPNDFRDKFMPPLREAYPDVPVPQPPVPNPNPHPRDPEWPCSGGAGGGPGGGPGGGGGYTPPVLPNPGAPEFGGGGGGEFGGGGGNWQIPPFPCEDPAYFPGAPIEVDVAGKKRKGRIAASDCETGEIDYEFPPYDDGYFDAPYCRRNILVVDAVKEIAAMLGMENADWTVDPDCQERWTGCYEKGHSMFDAMWELADLCGYGIFPPGEEIGPMSPLPVCHGPYHEARDFWGYMAQKDSKDIPAYVEVARPSVNGSQGFSVKLPVNTPYRVAETKGYVEYVGPGVSVSAAENKALKLKAYFEIRAKAHEVTIPYNEFVDQRHQITLERPSEGFTERSMIITYEHDVDMTDGGGAVTKLVVSEISRQTYPKRDVTFAEVWGTLEAGMNIPRTVDAR